MRWCFCHLVFFLVPLIYCTTLHALRLRIRQDGSARKLVKFLERVRARDKIPLAKFKTVPGSFKPLPFPVNFSAYDQNGDAKIEITELVRVTGTAENVNMAFSASDLNEDGFVTEEEYNITPWGYNQGDIILNNDEENNLEN